MTPDYWQNALDYLSKRDKHLAKLIQQFPNLALQSREDAFQTLIRSIVGQQISVKAADSVWQKIITHFGNNLSYQTIGDSDINMLRQCGLSQQKANYLLNIAAYFSQHNIDENYWQKFDYHSIYQQLIGIKGVGTWTIEMFAIFYLLEPDILPKKDLGLIRAIERLYQQEKNSLKYSDIDDIAHKWQPYRTVATWYLWRSIDAEVVTY